MKLRFKICCVFMCGVCSTASAHVLHIGDKTFQLDAIKRTSPALCVGLADGVFYGTLYSGDAPGPTMHVWRGASEYWLGQNCVAGKYSETGMSACTDCGVGHYCTGGSHRAACTHGAISCSGTGATTDAPMPASAPVNKFMTLDEVNEFMPVTDFSDWRQISCCSVWISSATSAQPETLNNVSNACASGTIGPGTYLFTMYYNASGETGAPSANIYYHAVIAVFDHPVAYASIHGNNIYQHFVDTEHSQYTARTISTRPIGSWQVNKNETNITNISDLPEVQNLCVFELK